MKSKLAERAMLVFEDVFLLEGEERRHAIHQACDGDEALRREVELLLENISGIEIDEPDPHDEGSSIPFVPSSKDRYELLNEIGRGGMGVVYRAFDSQLDREVAVKVIRDSANGREGRQRFAAEAIISAKLQHPGIPPVHNAGTLSDGRPFLAMKLVEGQTLSSVLADRDDQLADQPRLLAMFDAICKVMAYVHSHDVIHRDLKPDNVMVGAFGEVQIMDWGLAKVIDESGNERNIDAEMDSQVDGTGAGSRRSPLSHETLFGLVMGTPAYMPPEQTEGKRGKQTDVFSLGAILCEILTGHPPYLADSATELLSKSAGADLSGAMERLRTCTADQELVLIATSCLQGRAEDRPADAVELAKRVSAYLESMQCRLRAAELENAQSETKAVEEKKRRRVSAILMATASLLVSVLFGGWAWMSHQASQQTRRESDRRAAAVAQLDDARTHAIRMHQTALEASLDDVTTWEIAQAAIEQAQAMLSTDVPDKLAAEIDQLAGQISQSLSDRKMLKRIERARERATEQISRPDQPDSSERDQLCEQFQSVFEKTPLDPESADTVAARGFIQSRNLPVKEAIIGAVDEWIVLSRAEPQRRWLAEMVGKIDDNLWRNDWRSAVVERDTRKLIHLLDAELTFAQSPRSVINLCRSVNVILPAKNTVEPLRRVSERHVDDFWLQVALGDRTSRIENRQAAVQHYQQALAKRKISSLYRKLAKSQINEGRWTTAYRNSKFATEINEHSADSWEMFAIACSELQRLGDAGHAYARSLLLNNGKLGWKFHYINFLDRTGRRLEAIDYLSGLQESRDLPLHLHFKLVSLLRIEDRFSDVVEECNRLSDRLAAELPTNNAQRILAAARIAVQAYDVIRTAPNGLTDEGVELCRNAHTWMGQVLAQWQTRRAPNKVISQIVRLRNSGQFDCVFLSDMQQELPNDLRLAWSDFWLDVEKAEDQVRTLDLRVLNAGDWTVLSPVRVSSQTGASFTSLDDGSMLASAESNPNDIFVIECETDPVGINAIRLEALADDRLPQGGPGTGQNGDFQLTEIELQVPDEASPRGVRRLSFQDYASTMFAGNVRFAIDGNHKTVWSMPNDMGDSQGAIFYLQEPIPAGSGERLTIRLIHGGTSLGRFRLSFQRAKLEP